jgi:hypothetical protein
VCFQNADEMVKMSGLVDPVALRLGLSAKRALKGVGFFCVRSIPSPDAALGDGNSRSAAIATVAVACTYFDFEITP